MLSNKAISKRELLFLAIAAFIGIIVLPCLNAFVPPTSFWHVSNFSINTYGKYLCYAVLAIGVNLLLNWIFTFQMNLGHRGLALSTGGVATINFLALYVLMRRETGALEGSADLRGHAPGRHGRVRRSEARNGTHQLRGPHVRILGGREAVQVDRVGAQAQLAQDPGVGEEQRQHHPTLLELRTMPSR